VTPGQTQQVVAGTGLGLLHAYDGATGQDVSGFPKRTGGWLFAPAAISDDGRIADITREGYLFSWSVGAPMCQTQWPSWRHDPQGSGNYNRDGTPPGAPKHLTVTRTGHDTFQVSFVAPGNDDYCGTAAKYVAVVDGQPKSLDLGPAVPAGTTVTRVVSVPDHTESFGVFAVDAATNSGPAALVDVTGHGRGHGHGDPGGDGNGPGAGIAAPVAAAPVARTGVGPTAAPHTRSVAWTTGAAGAGLLLVSGLGWLAVRRRRLH